MELAKKCLLQEAPTECSCNETKRNSFLEREIRLEKPPGYARSEAGETAGRLCQKNEFVLHKIQSFFRVCTI